MIKWDEQAVALKNKDKYAWMRNRLELLNIAIFIGSIGIDSAKDPKIKNQKFARTRLSVSSSSSTNVFIGQLIEMNLSIN